MLLLCRGNQIGVAFVVAGVIFCVSLHACCITDIYVVMC